MLPLVFREPRLASFASHGAGAACSVDAGRFHRPFAIKLRRFFCHAANG
jgi:hypothetical protein